MSRSLTTACPVIVALLSLPLGAAMRAPGEVPVERTGQVPRTVLALYDGSRAAGPRDTTIHALTEMPLNHLGLVVRYHDLRHGVPSPDSLRGVRGVLTWFDSDAIPHAGQYLAWIGRIGRAGLPLVSLGALGGTRDDEGRPQRIEVINQAYEPFGWQVAGRWHTTTTGAVYAVQDRRVVGFERPLPRLVPAYLDVRASSPQARVALRVIVPDRPSTAADVVVLGPRGAYVAPGFTHFADRSGDREFRQWYVNPFELFRAAFGTDAVPKPDTATLSGRRLYYSHVDGDGWRNLTQIEPYRTRYVVAARVVLDEVVRRFPDLPVTVGAIIGDLDPEWAGTEESRAVARALYALPHVEAAIHTYSHPLDWAAFDARPPAPRPASEQTRVRGPDVLHGQGADTPRVYDTRPFSLTTEFDEAATYLGGLLPPGKRPALVQWSGDTRPFERALAHVRGTGLPNINGGDTRFDREFPSIAWVSPLGTWVGRELQVYASNSNENTYTDLWRDRFFGFTYLARTVHNTGVPRRLKPFNVYYHMYSGERLSSLNAVLANLAYARSLPLAPVEASRFSRIVEGFYSTTFDVEGPRRWRIRGRGALQTIRLDRATLEGVDFAASTGVVGQRHELGSLFVALDEREAAPLVALKPIPPSSGEPREDVPYLVDGRWRVHDVHREGEAVRFVAVGYGPGEMTWSWPRSGRVLIRWRAKSGTTGVVTASPDASGLVTIRLPMMTGDPVEVDMTAERGTARAGH